MDLDLSSEITEVLNGELGSDASLNGGDTIRCIFYNAYAPGRVSELMIEGSKPYADCKTSDVSSAAQDQSFVIGGVTYKVDEIQTGDDGWTKLILYKPNS